MGDRGNESLSSTQPQLEFIGTSLDIYHCKNRSLGGESYTLLRNCGLTLCWSVSVDHVYQIFHMLRSGCAGGVSTAGRFVLVRHLPTPTSLPAALSTLGDSSHSNRLPPPCPFRFPRMQRMKMGGKCRSREVCGGRG